MSVMAVNGGSSTGAAAPVPSTLSSGQHLLRNPTPGASRPSTPNMPMAKTSIPFSRMMSTVEYKHLRFIILDCPTEANLPLYKDEFKSRHVTDVVRVCEPTYNKAYFEENGIRVHDWPFKDGGVPPTNIINSFLALCDERFGGILAHKATGAGGTVSGGECCEGETSSPAIAVHCVAGLGRAPILVGICLVEAGMEPLDAVEFIRRRRRGALNSVQLQWLVDTYKRSWHKQSKIGGMNGGGSSGSGGKYGFLKRSGSPTGTQTPPQAAAATLGDEHSGLSASATEGLKEKVGKIFRFRKAGTTSSANSTGSGSSTPGATASATDKTPATVAGSSIAV